MSEALTRLQDHAQQLQISRSGAPEHLGRRFCGNTSFFDKHNPAPIGAIIYDFDFYTPTAIALNILNNDSKFYLPRIFNYFDNTLGNNKSCFNEFTGERLAIKEFNENNEKIKIAQPYNLNPRDNFDLWYKQIWITHIFNHKDYCKYIGDKIEK